MEISTLNDKNNLLMHVIGPDGPVFNIINSKVVDYSVSLYHLCLTRFDNTYKLLFECYSNPTNNKYNKINYDQIMIPEFMDKSFQKVDTSYV